MEFRRRKRKISEVEQLKIHLDVKEMNERRICKNMNDLKKKRRWDQEMDHDIMVNIMKRLSWENMDVSKLCKAWLLAALDAFFPSQK
ncbi:hypothetical protein CCACVL1_14124 [Corchorus capsularis]|uniref:Uncharacterized protein n=1 Tax=Corchorus capsularis TaxID=210143 RepID=A0A1R3I854_COCAP|nr:hypothetical protein CCACVL1_14124 [Corchorus capsularis]